MFTSNRVFGVSSTRANVKGDGWASWGENVPVTAVTNTQSYLRKRTHGYFYIPRFEYKTDTLFIEGTGLISQSLNDYGGNQSYQLPGNNLAGVTLAPASVRVSASRPADSLYAWKIVQAAGPDWADVSNYKAAATGYPTFGYDGRYNREVNLQARIDARYIAPFAMPTWFKAGANILETTYIFRNLTNWQSWNYIGPGGGPGGSWAFYPSAAEFQPGHNSEFISLSGRTAAIWDHNTIGQLFRSHPEYFVQNTTPANYQAAFINSPKYIREQVDAAYAMFDTQPLPKLELQGGVRWEQTRDQTRDLTPLPASQVVAAGYPVNAATGLATTIPGLQYQYFSKPRTSRTVKYKDLFPSAGVKYSITPNLQAMVGYSYTVTRPAFGDLSGTYTENETTQEINAPNPLLKPQYSNNYSARAMYYFEPVGSLGVGVFENDIRSFTQTARIQGSAGDFGFTDPFYQDYTIITKNNIPGTVIYRGATIEYRQTLSFLPAPFKGLTVFGNYTRTYTKMKVPDPTQLTAPNNPYNFGWIPGVAPHVINGGFSYHLRRLTFGLNARWTADMPTTSTRDTWMQQNVKFDMDVSYDLTNRFKLFFNSRNLTNVPDHTYVGRNRDRIGGGRAIEYYGAYFYGGVKAAF
jgi:TonB-dependent receptor